MQRLCLSVTILLLCTACASPPHRPAPRYSASHSVSIHGTHSDVVRDAKRLTGTPYRYGGESPRTGFDCSGFVRYVYRHATGLTLPRTTKAMSRSGRYIPRSKLRPGDLVFYNTQHRNYSHVGIYLGNNRFAHAPSSGKRVEISKMSDYYWRRHYCGARRISLQ